MPKHQRQVPISSSNTRAARAAHARAKEEFKTYDTSAIRPKQKVWPVVVLIVLAVFIVAAIAVVAIFAYNDDADSPVLSGSESAIVIVEQGENAKNVTAALFKEHIIPNENKFMSLIESRGAAGSLIPGTYLFKAGMSVDEVLDALLAGPDSLADKLTVPEGLTLKQTAALVDEATNGRISTNDFIAASSDASAYATEYEFLSEVGNNSLEGFLFPKTYSILVTDDATSVIKKMLDQFQIEVIPLFSQNTTRKKLLDIYDTIKLASIVEKEGTPGTYATVAGVFYNRLVSKRPYLESDVTTAYEVGREPTGEEVHANTPYSTYTNEGLPPTPICNPSLDVINATLNPENTDYMYFYAYDDGTIKFSKTYDEHMKSFS